MSSVAAGGGGGAKMLFNRSISIQSAQAKRKVIVGVCGMARKVNSKPMKAIMTKMLELFGVCARARAHAHTRSAIARVHHVR